MRVINLRNNAVLADKAKVADSFFSRLIGLLGRSCLEKGEALILKPSCSIRTVFMRFTIDVLFLDKEGKVIALLPSFKAFCFSPVYFNAYFPVELPDHTLKLTQTQPGDLVKITPD